MYYISLTRAEVYEYMSIIFMFVFITYEKTFLFKMTFPPPKK